MLAAVQLAIAAWIANLSVYFAYGAPPLRRPIPLVVLLLMTASLLHLLSVHVGRRIAATRKLVWTILGVAIALRAIWLVSHPILEIDIYRYMWDGAVMAQGVSPFDYSPLRVQQADPNTETIGPQLQRLVELREADWRLHEILRRVHFAEIRTIYPPVSQAVFALATAITPSRAEIATRLLVMKLVLVVFDMSVLAMLLHLLRRCDLHPSASILWGWSPLVLKEFAGSGHLDSIAVALCMAALLVAVDAWRASPGGRFGWSVGGLLLGLAVGAKLYPIVLLPLLGHAARLRSGWGAGLQTVAICGLASCMTLAPMVYATLNPPADAPSRPFEPPPPPPTMTESPPGSPNAVASPLPAQVDPDERHQTALAEARRTDGLRAFLSRWQMNDLFFMVIEENVRPASARLAAVTPWFAVTTDRFRASVAEWVAEFSGLEPERAGFWIARAITGGMLVIIAVVLTVRLPPTDSPRVLLAAAGLTLAWLWMLSPTQNPWYWSWALPLVPFVRNSAWKWVSTFALLYYLRFWFAYQFQGRSVWGTHYQGADFFDFVVVWWEHLPIWCALIVGAVWHRVRVEPLAGPVRD
ncbi:MAG: hypothetical protein D6753_05970 [Planctomycetota bacterium]|nr:MAG: hypothetical protein D6753_05970 [Planctomycetota bacterium]